MTAGDFETAERELFAEYGVPFERRTLQLADPPLAIGALETGSGPPVLFVHGSGMSGATWAPVLAHLPDRRAIAIDLPGFGRSDAYDYASRPLRAHAVAQLISVLDALGLDRAPIVGTSLGAMWGLCLAADAPERVSAVFALGMPAVALDGVHGDLFFTIMTVPGLGRLVSHAPAPRSAAAARRAMARVMGPRALRHASDAYFEVVRTGMARAGWGRAMWSHLNLAMRMGRARPGNALRDDELRAIAAPVVFIWGDADVYGDPEIGRRAVGLLPDGRIEVIQGGHAPFLDDAERCAELIRELT